jgi:hypothetical protein
MLQCHNLWLVFKSLEQGGRGKQRKSLEGFLLVKGREAPTFAGVPSGVSTEFQNHASLHGRGTYFDGQRQFQSVCSNGRCKGDAAMRLLAPLN